MSIMASNGIQGGSGLIVDLGDPSSMADALATAIRALGTTAVRDRLAAGKLLDTEYGTLDEDGRFVSFGDDEAGQERGSEFWFFSAAVEVPELRPLVQQYVNAIIDLNRGRRRPVWATDDEPAGNVAAALLAFADAAYLSTYAEMLATSSDGGHDVYQDRDAEAIVARWGMAATLAIAMDRAAVSKAFLDDIGPDLRAFAAESESNMQAVCLHFASRLQVRYVTGQARPDYYVNCGEQYYGWLIEALLPNPEQASAWARTLHRATLNGELVRQLPGIATRLTSLLRAATGTFDPSTWATQPMPAVSGSPPPPLVHAAAQPASAGTPPVAQSTGTERAMARRATCWPWSRKNVS